MGIFRRRSDAESSEEQDPLSPHLQSTVRRPVDRGATEPLDTGGTGRHSPTQVDGSDFASRNVQRRQRQGTTRMYTDRFGEVARRMDNRQLIYIAAGIILLLIALLLWRALSRRNDNTGIENTPADTAGQTEDQPGSAVNLPQATAGAAADLLLGTAAPLAIPDVGPTVPAATGEGWVVARTNGLGLFLRGDPATTSNTIATLPDGTRVQSAGEPDFNDGTRTWKNVVTQGGQEGWVAAEFLDPAQ